MVDHGKAIRTLWKDRCMIETSVEYTKANKAKGKRWETLVSDEPCKLSFFNNVRLNNPSVEMPMAAQVFQRAKLFIRPDLNIPAGCRITVVTHKNNITLYFENSGIPAFFTNHQEILLEVKQKWA